MSDIETAFHPPLLRLLALRLVVPNPVTHLPAGGRWGTNREGDMSPLNARTLRELPPDMFNEAIERRRHELMAALERAPDAPRRALAHRRLARLMAVAVQHRAGRAGDHPLADRRSPPAAVRRIGGLIQPWEDERMFTATADGNLSASDHALEELAFATLTAVALGAAHEAVLARVHAVLCTCAEVEESEVANDRTIDWLV